MASYGPLAAYLASLTNLEAREVRAALANLLADDGATIGANPIAAYGDSLTEGVGRVLPQKIYPIAAAIRLNVLNFPYNRGIGGQTSTQIAARQGGRVITVTLSGNEIPASGGVSVTAKNINVLTAAGAFSGTITGRLGGISGTMSTDASGNWTFTRTANGSIVAVSPDTQFFVDRAISDRTYTQWIFAGDNNIAEPEVVLADIAAMVAYLGHMRFRVISLLPNATWSAGNLALMTSINDALSATYGVRYVDGLAALKAANDGSPEDLADVAAGFTPRSLRVDHTHLNDLGYETLGIAVANSYLRPDRTITPALGVASQWGEFDSSEAWGVGTGWSFANGRLYRDGSATASGVLRQAPELEIGKNYRMILRGYYGVINLQNGSQYISFSGGTVNGSAMYKDFTSSATNIGVQGASACELLNVSILPL